jgi:Ribosome biogenesis protein Nop16
MLVDFFNVNLIFSYTALGLVSSLNPHASGGTERGIVAPQDSNNSSNMEQITTSQPFDNGAKVPRGYGRISRDRDGNVIDIQLFEEEDDEAMQWNEHHELDGTPLDEKLMNWVQLGANQRTCRSEGKSVVQGEFIKFC